MRKMMLAGVLFLVAIAALFAISSRLSTTLATDKAEAAELNKPTLQPASDPAVLADRASKCKKAVLNLRTSTGAWRTYSFKDGYAQVEVDTPYYLATFQDKRTLDAAMRCVFSGGEADGKGMNLVQYIDIRDHKEVAKWSSSTGFSVD